MSKRKNFFYRVNPCEVLAEVVFIDEKEKWFMQFFQDLKNDDPDAAKLEISANIIREAHDFRQLRSKAGKASVRQKANKSQHMLNICSDVLQQKPTSSSINSSTITEDKTLLLDCFEKLWKLYPKKDGKKEALRHFLASVGTVEEAREVNLALYNYIEYIEGKDMQYVKNGSTWFNNWQDWRTPQEDLPL